MKAEVVVDVGNSRVKWGRCSTDAVIDVAALGHDDIDAWQARFERWNLSAGAAWVVSGVAPPTRDALIGWLRARKQNVQVLESYRQLPLRVLVDFPEQVGIDRLLGAVAANARRGPNQPAVVIDAGSAVTINVIDAGGAFRGGAIFPGLRLMARALHQHTALLPLVDVGTAVALPATNTRSAIEAGIVCAVVGGIHASIERLSERPAAFFLTGGDASLLASELSLPVRVWSEMTLEGIRLSAATWPD